jgi:hypothetical protein
MPGIVDLRSADQTRALARLHERTAAADAAIPRRSPETTMSEHKVCYQPDCLRPGELGLGWGLSTGLVQWYCPEHYVPALSRLAGLLRAVRTVLARAA